MHTIRSIIRNNAHIRELFILSKVYGYIENQFYYTRIQSIYINKGRNDL